MRRALPAVFVGAEGARGAELAPAVARAFAVAQGVAVARLDSLARGAGAFARRAGAVEGRRRAAALARARNPLAVAAGFARAAVDVLGGGGRRKLVLGGLLVEAARRAVGRARRHGNVGGVGVRAHGKLPGPAGLADAVAHGRGGRFLVLPGPALRLLVGLALLFVVGELARLAHCADRVGEGCARVLLVLARLVALAAGLNLDVAGVVVLLASFEIKRRRRDFGAGQALPVRGARAFCGHVIVPGVAHRVRLAALLVVVLGKLPRWTFGARAVAARGRGHGLVLARLANPGGLAVLPSPARGEVSPRHAWRARGEGALAVLMEGGPRFTASAFLVVAIVDPLTFASGSSVARLGHFMPVPARAAGAVHEIMLAA